MPPRRPSPTLLAHLLLFGVVIVWGTTFVLVKDALHDASPLAFNLARMALATAALLVLNRRHLRRISRRQWRNGIAAGILLAAGYQFQTLGLARTTATKSALLTGLVVVLVPSLTLIPALRLPGAAPPGPVTALGSLLAFAGLLLLTTPPGTAPRHLFTSIQTGDLLTLACALAFAGHLLVLSRAAMSSTSAGLLATLQIATATLVMLLTLPLEGSHALTLTPRLLAALLITGLLGTAAAFTIQSFAQQHLPATHTAVLLTLEPVFAWLTSLLVLHERMSARALLGASLILAGILAVELLGRAVTTTEIPA